MKRCLLGLAILVLCIALMPALALAHHGTRGLDTSKRMTFKGVVSKLVWANPHVWIYMDLKDEKSGKTTSHGFELPPPHLLQGQTPPLNKDVLKVGTELTVVAVPYINEPFRFSAREITLKNMPRMGINSSNMFQR